MMATFSSRRLFSILFIALLLAVTTGCGQKGDLFLPEQPDTPGSEVQSDDPDVENTRQRSS